MLVFSAKERDIIVIDGGQDGDPVILFLSEVGNGESGKHCKMCIEAPAENGIFRWKFVEERILEAGYKFYGLREEDGSRMYKKGKNGRIVDVITLIKELF